MARLYSVCYQVDLCAEELNNSVVAGVAIQADVGVVATQLHQALKESGWKCDKRGAWWGELSKKCKNNQAVVQVSTCYAINQSV